MSFGFISVSIFLFLHCFLQPADHHQKLILAFILLPHVRLRDPILWCSLEKEGWAIIRPLIPMSLNLSSLTMKSEILFNQKAKFAFMQVLQRDRQRSFDNGFLPAKVALPSTCIQTKNIGTDTINFLKE